MVLTFQKITIFSYTDVRTSDSQGYENKLS